MVRVASTVAVAVAPPGETVSQAPPEVVAAAAPNSIAPPPSFDTVRVWERADEPWFSVNVNVSSGTLKPAGSGGSTTRFTAMIRTGGLLFGAVMVTAPRYEPGARDAGSVEIEIAAGMDPTSVVVFNQSPPSSVFTVTLNSRPGTVPESWTFCTGETGPPAAPPKLKATADDVYEGGRFRMTRNRWFPQSAMYRFPAESRVTAVGTAS